jgi:hypothetical protein
MAQQTTNDKIYQAVDKTRLEINGRIDHLENKIDSNYVTREEFVAQINPIRAIAYGLVGIVMLSVVGAILSLVLKAGK